jgi:hypothetical protein
MAYKVTVTYTIATAPEARDRDPKEVQDQVQKRLQSSLGFGLNQFWTVDPSTVKVRVRRG